MIQNTRNNINGVTQYSIYHIITQDTYISMNKQCKYSSWKLNISYWIISINMKINEIKRMITHVVKAEHIRSDITDKVRDSRH